MTSASSSPFSWLWIVSPRTGRLLDRSLAGSPHQHVAELPGILGVDVFREQAGAIVQRGPVGVVTLYRAQIRHLNFQQTIEIHLVGFDDAFVRVFQRPHHAAE